MSDRKEATGSDGFWDRFDDDALTLIEQRLLRQHSYEIDRKRLAETKAAWLLTGATIAVTVLMSSVSVMLAWGRELHGHAILTSSRGGPLILMGVGVLLVSAIVALVSACLRAIQVQAAGDIVQDNARAAARITPGTARAVRLDLIASLCRCISTNDDLVSRKVGDLRLAQRSLKVALILIAVLGLALSVIVGWTAMSKGVIAVQ